uniref:DNA-directed DNA polymerase n=1 Tax=Globodera rostochiensis TaxID=31243 RepID=A0A914HLZ0_GLORO
MQKNLISFNKVQVVAQLGAGRRRLRCLSPVVAEDDDDDDIDQAIDQYCTVTGVWERTKSRSRATRCETVAVQFHNWHKAPQPEGLLSRCLQHLLDRVLASRPAPLRVGVACQPPGWDNAFHIPLRDPRQNNADALASALEAFAKHYDGLDLFSGNVRFRIVAVWPLSTPRVEGCCAENEAMARGTVRCHSFVPIINGGAGDRWCLARAIIIGLADRHICVVQRQTVAHFRVYCIGQRGVGGLELAEQLLLSAGVPLNRPTYGVRDMQRIQQWLDHSLGANEVRLVLFEREAGFRVAWKGAQRALFNLCLVAQNGHFGYIQRPEQLIHARQYCVECESAVDRRTHPQGCRAVCPRCFRFGFDQPCQRNPGEDQSALRCADCQFVFPNADCFAAHRRRVEPPPPGWEHDRRRGQIHRPLCEERRVCPHCGQIVWARAGRHICDNAGANLAFRPNQQQRPPQQQQQQPLNIGAAPQCQPQQLCAKCKGPHDPTWTPHFIQPKHAMRQAPWENDGNDECNVEADSDDNDDDDDDDAVLPLVLEQNVDGDDDDDDGEAELNGADVAHAMPELAPQCRAAGRGPKRRRPLRFLFWDIECEQRPVHANDDDEVGADVEEAAAVVVLKHVPVLICAEVLCERCIALGVDIEREPMRRAPGCFCGAPWRGEKRRRWALPAGADAFSDDEEDVEAGMHAQEQPQQAPVQMPVDGRNPRRLHFFTDPTTGRSAMEQFVEFLLHTGPLNICTLMLAHNGGRYDVHLLLEELQRQGVIPQRLVATGLRVYTMVLGGRNQRHVIVKDTLNFFGCALSKLPATFGLRGVRDKPYFPYAYISEANMDVPLADGTIPPVQAYDPDRMKPAERIQFLAWYEAEQQRQRQHPFLLRRELLRYCANDVRLLRSAALRFREIVGGLAGGMEPFMAASTIAGLALAIYRQCHLRPNTMVHTPEGGFLRRRGASAASRHFFALLERRRPELRGRIRTARWSIGEATVEDDGYRMDALLYRPVPLRPLVIEFNGCYFHGCPVCFPQRQQPLAGGQQAELLLARTQQRAWELENRYGYELQTVWECEFRRLLHGSKALRRLYDEVCRTVPAPLDLRRDALFGGRVEPFSLHYACCDDEEIDDLDIVSLYPFVMKYRSFPVGLPRVLAPEQLNDLRLPWTQPEDNPYTGFLQCRVLPPTPARLGARHTLLPYRTRGGRLTFPLCAKCAERGNADTQRRQRASPLVPRALPRCRHADHQRSWCSAFTHVELNAALALGYRVLAVYEVWDYTAWTSLEAGNSLFSGYVDLLLRLKVEASGWPADCVTADQRARFVDAYAQREGIHIDAQHVEHNPGLRAVVKALLNALWGKLAQRAERDEVRYTGSAREFHDLLADPRQEVVDFVHLNEQLDRCVVRRRHPFVQAPATNNLAVACFVTAHARVYLHERLEEVRASGGRPLYCDTDSVLFVKQRDAARLPSEGDALGQLKREFPGRRIVQFFSAGPKNYGFRHLCARTGGDERAERKVRGLELTYTASQLLPFDRMCQLVLNFFGRRVNAERHVEVPQRRFVRTKRAEILTRATTKVYKPVYTKGLVVAMPQTQAPGGTAYFTRPFGWYDERLNPDRELTDNDEEERERHTDDDDDDDDDDITVDSEFDYDPQQL